MKTKEWGGKMKSFVLNKETERAYRFEAGHGVSESISITINEMVIKAYHKGAEEIRKEMFEFFKWYIPACCSEFPDKWDLEAPSGIDECYEYWKQKEEKR